MLFWSSSCCHTLNHEPKDGWIKKLRNAGRLRSVDVSLHSTAAAEKCWAKSL